jgi:hypothetical protein
MHVNVAEVDSLESQVKLEQATAATKFLYSANRRLKTDVTDSAPPADFGNIAEEDYAWHPASEGVTQRAPDDGEEESEEPIDSEMIPNMLNFANGTRRTCGCSDKGDISSCFDGNYSPTGEYSCPLIWHTYTTEDVFIAGRRMSLNIFMSVDLAYIHHRRRVHCRYCYADAAVAAMLMLLLLLC